MPSTSGTFNFQSIEVELIIREAFERIGVLGEFVEPQKLESGKRSIDFLLLEWISKTINLWTLKKSYLPLNQGQSLYTLPNTVSKIIQAASRTSTRQLNGTPASSNGGTAANAFDGDSSTACTQNNINGNISYDYGAGSSQAITFIGIQSNTLTSYSITVEYSQDNINWRTLFVIPKQSYEIGINNWFDVPVTKTARAYRIRETGGATLNIQEIFFNNNVYDLIISNVSRSEMTSFPNKQIQGRPNVYYFDRQIAPSITLWPVPSNAYNCLLYSYEMMIEDVGVFYTNAVQIPSRFYPALVWGLTWMLAIKYKPEAAEMFHAEYEKSFSIASEEDTENAVIRIYPDYTGSGIY